MIHEAQISPSLNQKESEAQAVRFPPHDGAQHPPIERFLSFCDLLPWEWRRQVVIHGQRFWLPG
jgi:hypothetical protein